MWFFHKISFQIIINILHKIILNKSKCMYEHTTHELESCNNNNNNNFREIFA